MALQPDEDRDSPQLSAFPHSVPPSSVGCGDPAVSLAGAPQLCNGHAAAQAPPLGDRADPEPWGPVVVNSFIDGEGVGEANSREGPGLSWPLSWHAGSAGGQRGGHRGQVAWDPLTTLGPYLQGGPPAFAVPQTIAQLLPV